MTGSLRFLARDVGGDIPTDTDERPQTYGDALAVNLGSRQLTRKQELLYHAASFVAHDTLLSDDDSELTEIVDFEIQRKAWLLAKDIVELSMECGGDLARYVNDTGEDAEMKSKVASFIPLALEAQRLKDEPVV